MEQNLIRDRIADNLEMIRENIARAAGRRAVTIVCVTKYAHEKWVSELLAAGATHLGENLLPKGSERFARLRESGYRFQRHLIGPQQSRKIRLISDNFDWFQAVDRVKVAGLLNSELKERGMRINALLQVNISQEESKHGFRLEECLDAFDEIKERFSSIRLRGLMAIPRSIESFSTKNEYERATRRDFQAMKSLFDKIARLNPGAPGVDTLSLGMTQDYIWAVQEGATMVRIGSALYDGLEG